MIVGSFRLIVLSAQCSVLRYVGGEKSEAGSYRRVAQEGFEDLAVYQRAAALADEMRASVRSWESVDQWTVGVQAIRAADSICANIAEAMGRQSHADQSRILYVSRGSATELQNWLQRASERGLACPVDARKRIREIGRMLNGLIRAFAPRD
jgi:four helix bundle protein